MVKVSVESFASFCNFVICLQRGWGESCGKDGGSNEPCELQAQGAGDPRDCRRAQQGSALQNQNPAAHPQVGAAAFSDAFKAAAQRIYRSLGKAERIYRGLGKVSCEITRPWVCGSWAWREGPAWNDISSHSIRALWDSFLFQFCPALLVLKETL